MNLGQALDRVHELTDDACIFARKPWTPLSESVVAPLGDSLQVPTEIASSDLVYFMEVCVAKEVLEVFGERPASKDEERRLLFFFAENDAYPEWVYER